MEHCYIFDYSVSAIYHIILPDNIEDVETYICETYNLRPSDIHFMITEEKVEIQGL